MQEMKERWRAVAQEAGFGGLELERVLVEPKRRRMMAEFAADGIPDRAGERALQKAFSKRFAQWGVQVRVSCPLLAEDFCADPGQYADYLTSRLLEDAPGASRFLRNAQWCCQGGRVQLSVKGEAGASYLKERGVVDQLQMLIKTLFKLDMQVVTLVEEDEEEFLERREEEEAIVRAIAAERERLAKEQGNGTQEKVLFGSKVSGAPTPIGELNEDAGVVLLEGRALSLDTRLLKGGTRMLVSFGMTDFTGSIMVKVFAEPSEERKAKQIAEGAGLRIKGECRYDSFSKEIAVIARDVMLMPLPQREDDAPEKRVELHLHTQMSAMDGVSSVSSLIRRAAAWGQEAVAVTDHGVLQAFPEAFDLIRSLEKANTPIKLIPGMEGYLVDDGSAIAREPDDGPLRRTYVVLDVETTGLNPRADRLTEIGAVRIVDGQLADEFTTFVDPGMPIPEKVTKLTGITQEMVAGAPAPDKAIAALADFLGQDVYVAHNASFDSAFLEAAAQRAGVSLPRAYVDMLALSRALLKGIKNYKLNTVCKELGVPLKNHHRALYDARATASAFIKLLDKAEQAHDIQSLSQLNIALGRSVAAGGDSNHIVLLAASEKGLFNLYKLTSLSHMDYFYRKPRIPRSVLQKHREGLIIGSACEAGELFQAILDKRAQQDIEAIASFYDYLEIQPTGNNAFLVREGIVADDEGLRALNREIVALGEKLNIPVCATCDVHFLDPEDAIFREILMQNKNFSDAANQAPLYMRTTQEMLDEFAYLGEQKAYEVVVTNTRAIAARVQPLRMFPEHPRGETTFQPTLADAERVIEETSWRVATRMYGEELPPIVRARVEKELKAIVGNGFATLYYSAQLLVEKSMQDGYLVGSRGSVGSSLVAMLIGVTEINSLAPHYLCPSCQFSDFDVDSTAYPCGEDLPDRDCPRCGTALMHDGYDIPFEMFMGYEGDKVPDIDLNFSGEYQAQAQEYVKTIFGEGNVYKAGTIGTLAEKKAFGEVLAYLESVQRTVTSVERARLAKGITGVKLTTGQHPGGMVVVPKEYDIHHFSPINHPADKKDSGVVTTHFDFGSLHDILVKLDILGHDDPTMIYMLEKLTGVKALEVPLTDPKVMSLFSSPEALGVTAEQIGSKTGTLGIPEFGTAFVRGMLEETKPSTMSELLRISGLSHGTNVWLNNAQKMIAEGTATLKTCFCTREDIMHTLMQRGMDEKTAFTITEIVRKDYGKKRLMKETELVAAMREVGLEEHLIESLFTIEYMFPRSHAAAYVKMALRVAYFKVYHPLAYYAAFFTVRADEFDAAIMLADADRLRAMMKELRESDEDSAKDERVLSLLESVLEMRERGLDFLPVDLYKSSANEFLIEEGCIRPPLNRVGGVGGVAAEAIALARQDGEFLSVEDMQGRAKVSRAVVDALREQGCLDDMAASSQVTLF